MDLDPLTLDLDLEPQISWLEASSHMLHEGGVGFPLPLMPCVPEPLFNAEGVGFTVLICGIFSGDIGERTK